MRVQTDISHREAKSLFFALADEELETGEEARLRAHLNDCVECRAGWDQYAKAVQLLRGTERERAPEGLASMILRRVRRRRMFASRGLQLAHLHYRVPAEAIIPILIGVAVAAFLVLAAP